MVSNSSLGRSAPPVPQFLLSKEGQPVTDLLLEITGSSGNGTHGVVVARHTWGWSGSIEDPRLHRGRRRERLPPIYNEFEANLGSLKPCLKTNKRPLPLVKELPQRFWGPVPRH